jgi:hypothetical protein
MDSAVNKNVKDILGVCVACTPRLLPPAVLTAIVVETMGLFLSRGPGNPPVVLCVPGSKLFLGYRIPGLTSRFEEGFTKNLTISMADRPL